MLVPNRGTRGSPGSVSLVTQGDGAGSCRVKVAPSSPVPRHWVPSPHSAASRQGRTHGGEASLGLCCIFSFEDESPAALPVAFAMTEEQNPARNSGRPSFSSLPSQSLFLSYLPEVFPSCPGVSVLAPSPRGQIVCGMADTRRAGADDCWCAQSAWPAGGPGHVPPPSGLGGLPTQERAGSPELALTTASTSVPTWAGLTPAVLGAGLQAFVPVTLVAVPGDFPRPSLWDTHPSVLSWGQDIWSMCSRPWPPEAQ